MTTGTSPTLSFSVGHPRHPAKGVLPRRLTLVAMTIALLITVWGTILAIVNHGDPDIAIAGLVFFLVSGGILAHIAHPHEANRMRILTVWTTLVTYVSMIVGAGMLIVVYALAPDPARVDNGTWGEPWNSLSNVIINVSLLAFIVMTLATPIIYHFWRHEEGE